MARKFNANIFLSDVHPLTGQMTEKFIGLYSKNNLKKIKAIITMFLGGYPENISKFYQIKKKFKAVIIEDACHALVQSIVIKVEKNFRGLLSLRFKCFFISPCKNYNNRRGWYSYI